MFDENKCMCGSPLCSPDFVAYPEKGWPKDEDGKQLSQADFPCLTRNSSAWACTGGSGCHANYTGEGTLICCGARWTPRYYLPCHVTVL